MPIEEWRPVVGYEGLYDVSSSGRVRSRDRVIKSCECGRAITTLKGKLVTRINRDHGYPSCSLSKGGKARIALVHRLVLEAFIGPCPDGMEGCHTNGNRKDARIVNLRWDTRKNNHADRWAHGTMLVGEQTNSVKLTEDKVRAIRASAKPHDALAAEYGVARGTIYRIKARQTWRHVRP